MQVQSSIRCYCLIFVMQLMVLVDARDLMHPTMNPHEEEIVHYQHSEESLDDLGVGRESLQTHLGARDE